ncbi:MAG: flagellar assembly protein A [Candidatus Accumulibacter sp. UW20]|jgi:hypothetical protein
MPRPIFGLVDRRFWYANAVISLTVNMPSYPASAIDQTGNLHDGELALSRFIVQGDGGLYVNRSLLDSARDFSDFVDRIFGSGLYFRGLDYARLQSLLYDEGLRSGDERDETVFLAADITLFRPQRQPLYKALSIASSEASYLFEPLYFEGEADPELIESTESRRQALRPDGHQASETRLYLDVDEFVASAWRQGVRFGIDVAVVREGIGLDKAERRVVARSRPCVAGTNAELIEEAPSLRRNNAPRRLLDDRVDLCRFVTRYPQVTASLRLLRKIPCTPGVDGCDIAGNPLPAPRPEDLQLDHLAGPGTHVEREAGGEYLVASVGGFLNVDSRSKRLSVADKIVSHEGVSVRTTGDLLLTGEVYEQYGEIQEKRIVQCRTITAHADVFGNILSSGGVVRLKSNLVGGSASNDDGDIFVDGRASGATLIAQHGCITVKQADNCVILAREVVIEQATNCSIVAEEVRVRICEASAMAARTLRVGSARSRRDLDSVLLLLVPDLSPYQAEIATLENKRSVLDSTIAGERARIDTLRSEPEVARYLLLAGKLRRQELTLNPEQQVAWRRLSAQVAPVLRTLAPLADLLRERDAQSQALRREIEAVIAARAQACDRVIGEVDAIDGETRISTLLVRLAETPLSALPGKELKARLRRADAATRLLFTGSAGHFSWRCSPPPD